jgi:hypothetical protein
MGRCARASRHVWPALFAIAQTRPRLISEQSDGETSAPSREHVVSCRFGVSLSGLAPVEVAGSIAQTNEQGGAELDGGYGSV